jgi:hypothetical protein
MLKHYYQRAKQYFVRKFSGENTEPEEVEFKSELESLIRENSRLLEKSMNSLEQLEDNEVGILREMLALEDKRKYMRDQVTKLGYDIEEAAREGNYWAKVKASQRKRRRQQELTDFEKRQISLDKHLAVSYQKRKFIEQEIKLYGEALNTAEDIQYLVAEQDMFYDFCESTEQSSNRLMNAAIDEYSRALEMKEKAENLLDQFHSLIEHTAELRITPESAWTPDVSVADKRDIASEEMSRCVKENREYYSQLRQSIIEQEYGGLK